MQKWLQFMTGWKSSVPELCTDFSKLPIFQTTTTENHRKSLSQVRLVAMNILPHISKDTGSAAFSPRKRYKESEVRHCWYEVLQHFFENRLKFSECYIL
jgi:hypothetical protein